MEDVFLFFMCMWWWILFELLGDPDNLYSCMIQSVLSPRGGFPLQKTRAFFTPMVSYPPELVMMGLSVPVAFQYPEAAARLGLTPFGYFLSLGLKKYHSLSPNLALAVWMDGVIDQTENPTRSKIKIFLKKRITCLTWKIPWIVFVDINFGYD